MVISYMATNGYRHGPLIHIKHRYGTSWGVELSHDGHVGHSPTTDPSSIELFVDVATGEVLDCERDPSLKAIADGSVKVCSFLGRGCS